MNERIMMIVTRFRAEETIVWKIRDIRGKRQQKFRELCAAYPVGNQANLVEKSTTFISPIVPIYYEQIHFFFDMANFFFPKNMSHVS